ncbi:NAD-dependent epimerase/dehydratase family protein [Tessaracoccus sp. MC1865]|uniref:NAD-dependent epimerase/dehydratase family protein n=1 Tax=Tessaracoccus sp. MC1865 TaxID=2760310 RepID=UPI0016034294|nr:NAD-dependent epimerase/dehydratase family protein [Tessaracoccus sp. MC1865]MBB1482324.1 NAD-dependent epimerase/dehydratase family protein [Tessaracoccus sp. MC1865]QTO38208.1 NAD-dependent epimerase/dehydratase family protein [Tessaracoccus sp. MC1865]
MKLLILGGTGFLGRAVVAEALLKGCDVTCLARGNGPVPRGAELVREDRNDDDALSVVSPTGWDAVIDLASDPGHARRAARDLDARRWVFVSTGSVYTRFDSPEQDEAAEVHAPLEADRMTEMTQYGPAKVTCEEAYRRRSPNHTIIRAGLIGGEGDVSGRSGYYPWRFAHPTGPDVLVPDPTFPTALIDVRDLADWIVHCAAHPVNGTFNAAGVSTTLAEVYELSRDISGSPAVPRMVDDATLVEAGIAPWAGPRSLPLWVDDPAWRYAATLDSEKARGQGLRTRPLRETLAAALAYEDIRTEPRRAGLTDEEELALRAFVEATSQGSTHRDAEGTQT